MLRKFLVRGPRFHQLVEIPTATNVCPQVDEFVGGPKGVGSKDIDGLFLDDGWTAKPHPKPAWADPGYYQCDMSNLGGTL